MVLLCFRQVFNITNFLLLELAPTIYKLFGLSVINSNFNKVNIEMTWNNIFKRRFSCLVFGEVDQRCSFPKKEAESAVQWHAQQPDWGVQSQPWHDWGDYDQDCCSVLQWWIWICLLCKSTILVYKAKCQLVCLSHLPSKLFRLSVTIVCVSHLKV